VAVALLLSPCTLLNVTRHADWSSGDLWQWRCCFLHVHCWMGHPQSWMSITTALKISYCCQILSCNRDREQPMWAFGEGGGLATAQGGGALCDLAATAQGSAPPHGAFHGLRNPVPPWVGAFAGSDTRSRRGSYRYSLPCPMQASMLTGGKNVAAINGRVLADQLGRGRSNLHIR
jgi:hypothetical protein